MRCLLSEWGVLSFTNMLLMELNVPSLRMQAAVWGGVEVRLPIMHLRQWQTVVWQKKKSKVKVYDCL